MPESTLKLRWCRGQSPEIRRLAPGAARRDGNVATAGGLLDPPPEAIQPVFFFLFDACKIAGKGLTRLLRHRVTFFRSSFTEFGLRAVVQIADEQRRHP